MDTPEQRPAIDPIDVVIKPPLRSEISKAYLRGDHLFVRYGPEGLEVKIIPADQFFADPTNPAARQPKP